MEENLIIDVYESNKGKDSHNRPEKEYDVSLSIMKHKIKDGIEKTKLFREYDDDIFVDDTFFIAPKFSYQIFITRTYAKELDSFYTTSFVLLKNKEQEAGISKVAKTIFPNTNIKYCIWHYKKLLDQKKNKLCYNEVKNDNNIFIHYKAISNLPFINPEYIFDVYVIIKIKSIKNNFCQFLKFLEYFYKTYLIDYDMKIWN
ncbi:hypothetical protein U3516DRAFT_773348 [Neocallimastix sp. 'constans']